MLSACALFLVGCASANVGNPNNNPDGPPPSGDGPNNNPDPDGPSPDGPPVTVTLSQTTATNILAGNTINCNDTVTTSENRYYRVFPLAQQGVANTFNLESVTFGVESAVSGAGVSQTATINVGTYSGTIAANTASLNVAQLTQLATAQAAIPNGDGGSVTTAITATIPPNSNLYVEILSPDAGNVFFPGTNAGGETFPGFIRADACDTLVPSNYSTTVGAASHLLLAVTGTH
jgi:hypothetical protein